MKKLLVEISNCTICKKHLPFAPRPVLQAGHDAKIIIIGQAPGLKVQQSGKPWDDASGKKLREWLGVDDETFYNPKKIALMPMGFCYSRQGLIRRFATKTGMCTTMAPTVAGHHEKS